MPRADTQFKAGQSGNPRGGGVRTVWNIAASRAKVTGATDAIADALISGLRFGVVPLEVVADDGNVVSLEHAKLAKHSPGRYVLRFDQWLALASRIRAPPIPTEKQEDDRPATLLDAMQRLQPAVVRWHEEQEGVAIKVVLDEE